jgi:CheY-like chemotaxis protein
MRILLVNDAVASRATTARWLEMLRGVEMVEITSSGSEALQMLGNDNPAKMLLVDSQLADMSAFDLVRRIKSLAFPPMVVMIARVLTQRIRAEAHTAGADHSIEKSQLHKELPPLLEGRPDVSVSATPTLNDLGIRKNRSVAMKNARRST